MRIIITRPADGDNSYDSFSSLFNLRKGTNYN